MTDTARLTAETRAKMWAGSAFVLAEASEVKLLR